ncbi:site-specific integrase [Haloplanus rallus]|uniref:Site-specific integrase n=1 Tax=Haloplanus rallus TaxID=1816183 RepID=A0A6B9F3K8_9EURY|nr:site-specific integrase [Haloplanus rallus]QGX94995.1 site-specific integrase [Haloplanus rallus]
MLTEPFDEKDGRRVWLSDQEVDLLLEHADEQRRRIAFALGARGGLRSHEVLDVAPAHVVDDDQVGTMLRIVAGKGDKPRETPIPPTLAATIRAIGEHRDADPDVPIIDRSTRTLRRWVTTTANVLVDETGDDRWSYLSFHDLRRTWAGSLANSDVDEQVALLWGGWADLETFLDHYRGEASPKAQRREREKVGWL